MRRLIRLACGAVIMGLGVVIPAAASHAAGPVTATCTGGVTVSAPPAPTATAGCTGAVVTGVPPALPTAPVVQVCVTVRELPLHDCVPV